MMYRLDRSPMLVLGIDLFSFIAEDIDLWLKNSQVSPLILMLFTL